ncbi:hypothetical protein [Aquitalea palustris]|uniref:hypothetical protein n=1 Tax=Aquitalea palustris TaxID=2480983 RepID=UPI001CF0C45E|nr:hypothetical protein [Aquitalea palustris]
MNNKQDLIELTETLLNVHLSAINQCQRKALEASEKGDMAACAVALRQQDQAILDALSTSGALQRLLVG